MHVRETLWSGQHDLTPSCSYAAQRHCQFKLPTKHASDGAASTGIPHPDRRACDSGAEDARRQSRNHDGTDVKRFIFTKCPAVSHVVDRLSIVTKRQPHLLIASLIFWSSHLNPLFVLLTSRFPRYKKPLAHLSRIPLTIYHAPYKRHDPTTRPQENSHNNNRREYLGPPGGERTRSSR